MLNITTDRMLHEAGQVALESRIKDLHIAVLEGENAQLHVEVKLARNERDELREWLAREHDLVEQALGKTPVPSGETALLAERAEPLRNT